MELFPAGLRLAPAHEAQDDRREVLLALTAKGEKILSELALHHHDELRGAAPELVTALRRIMRTGREAI